MNNKGFAITTILYGTLIIFSLLLVSMLGMLEAYRGNLEKLIENSNGARTIITIKEKTNIDKFENATEKGLYCEEDTGKCKYISKTEIEKSKS